MAELVALRAILLNVLFKLVNGQTLTAEEMQRLIDRADSDKVRKARERLAQAADSSPGSSPHKRVLWKWFLAVAGLILLVLAWQFGSAFRQGRTLANTAVREFHEKPNGGAIRRNL